MKKLFYLFLIVGCTYGCSTTGVKKVEVVANAVNYNRAPADWDLNKCWGECSVRGGNLFAILSRNKSGIPLDLSTTACKRKCGVNDLESQRSCRQYCSDIRNGNNTTCRKICGTKFKEKPKPKPGQCWETKCDSSSMSTTACKRQCGVKSSNDSQGCRSYCSARGGNSATCNRICGVSNTDEEKPVVSTPKKPKSRKNSFSIVCVQRGGGYTPVYIDDNQKIGDAYSTQDQCEEATRRRKVGLICAHRAGERDFQLYDLRKGAYLDKISSQRVYSYEDFKFCNRQLDGATKKLICAYGPNSNQAALYNWREKFYVDENFRNTNECFEVLKSTKGDRGGKGRDRFKKFTTLHACSNSCNNTYSNSRYLHKVTLKESGYISSECQLTFNTAKACLDDSLKKNSKKKKENLSFEVEARCVSTCNGSSSDNRYAELNIINSDGDRKSPICFGMDNAKACQKYVESIGK